MGIEAKAGFKGIVTAVGEATAPQGALRRADNVSLRKEGALTLRPPFQPTSLARAYAAAFPYKGLLYYVTSANAVYDPSQGAVLTNPSAVPPSTAPAAVRADIQSMKEARGNLYLATAVGIFKMTKTSASTLYSTGLNPTDTAFGYLSLNATGSNDLLAAGQQVAYRVVTVITDPNGVVIRSRPSGAVSIAATGAQSPSLTLYYGSFDANVAVDRKIEVYRTRIFPTTAAVDDEMQLIATLTPAPAAASSLTYIDKIPDTRRGQTLYTSPSRGGIESANDRPPAAACLERFRTSVFYGNTIGPHRYTVSYNSTPGNLVGSATGVGMRQTTGTNAAGANTITSVANTTGLQVGMRVATQTSGGYYSVTNIAGSTVTLSGNLPNAQTTQAVFFYDAITVDGTGIVVGVGGNNSSQYATTSAALGTADAAVRQNYTAYELSPAAAGYSQTVVIERIARGGVPFTVKATHGDEMSPALPLASSGGAGLSSTNDVFPHGLAWSEPDEPEHVPAKNFARVGDAGKAILALVATKDRLLIFKEDGLFMLVGNTAKDFGIYPLDTTCLCILPGSVRRMQNTVYALTNLGLVAVDEGGGVNIISRPIQQDIAIISHNIRTAFKASGLYLMPGLTGVTGTADDGAGEYWLALGTQTALGGQILVYNAFAQGFTTYSLTSGDPVSVAQSGEGLPLVLTSSALNTPVPDQTAIGTSTVATVRTRAFTDPALVNKLWVHGVVGFSSVIGAASVQMQFSGSEALVPVVEELEAYKLGGVSITHSAGTLMRHPIPRIFARSYYLYLGVTIDVQSGGSFTLELVGAEARENIPNKRPTHGSGST